ncbi:DUF3862 domain-containing protein [Clostridium hydrogeniformans]|uniref:DUF3862 domain-containing protein n=1 Tax=Clostridium hydrogeniformans TaxID=349933 RepID=UPI0005534E98|nr:DUF3862 domain-containing protein [Clostridium hydrogeniformans]
MKKKFYKKWWFWLIVVVIVGAGAAGAGSSKKDNGDSKTLATTESEKKDAKKDNDKKEEKKKEDSKVNYDNFLKIGMGSSYEDVVKIIGEGQESSSSEVAGIKSTIYTWKGTGISNVTITIQNGAVTGKGQAGLNKNKADINLEKYNKVETGMSLKEVENILGEGTLVSRTKIMNSESDSYGWVNKDGSNSHISFQGDKVTTKAQFQLK